MFRFRVKNAADAQALVSGLGSLTSPVSGRPFAGYLLFLATELDEASIEVLVDSLGGLDSITGPYVAGLVFVDKIRVELDDLDDGRVVQRAVTPARLLRLVEKGDCTHYDLEPRRLTRATDRVARALGVVGQMPCIAVVDFMGSGEIEVVNMPASKADLVKFIRELMSIVSAQDGERAVVAGFLESFHSAHQRRNVVREHLGRLDALELYLQRPTGSIQQRLVRDLHVPNAKVEAVVTPDLKKALRRWKKQVEPDSEARSELFALLDLPPPDEVEQHDGRREVAHRIIELIRPGFRSELRARHDEAERQMNECRTALVESGVPSLRDAAREVARRRELATAVHTLQIGVKTAVAEFAKPSMWLKILPFLGG